VEYQSVMKLLNCLECHDIVKLPSNGALRHCMCGKSAGRYRNDTAIELHGNSRSLSISGVSYKRSLSRVFDHFKWWVTDDFHNKIIRK